MIENERKFIVKELPNIDFINEESVEQYYLFITDNSEGRIRKYDSDCTFDIKRGGYVQERVEESIKISREDFDKLKRVSIGGITKTRYTIKEGVTIDIFHNSNLILLEVENTEFEIPDWVGKEVTGDKRYYNSYLVINGYDRKKKIVMETKNKEWINSAYENFTSYVLTILVEGDKNDREDLWDRGYLIDDKSVRYLNIDEFTKKLNTDDEFDKKFGFLNTSNYRLGLFQIEMRKLETKTHMRTLRGGYSDVVVVSEAAFNNFIPEIQDYLEKSFGDKLVKKDGMFNPILRYIYFGSNLKFTELDQVDDNLPEIELQLNLDDEISDEDHSLFAKREYFIDGLEDETLLKVIELNNE